MMDGTPYQEAGGLGDDNDAEMIDTALAAPTLADACKDLGIVPKSVSDVNCLRQNNRRKWAPEPIKFEVFKVHNEIDEWFERAERGTRGKGLLVVGPAFLGKSQYIKWKAGYNMVYMKGDMDWDYWDDNPEPSYLIIDDMKPEWIRENRKGLLGSDTFIVNPKYGKKRRMQPLPTICIVNELWEFDDYDNSVWDVVFVNNKVY